MGAGEIGAIIGGFMIAILLPALILIVCHFIPAAARNPKIVYVICGALAAFVLFVGINGGGNYVDASISASLAAAFLYWGYVRDAKKAASLKAAGSPQDPGTTTH